MTVEPRPESPKRDRVFTARALLIGSLLVVFLGILTPWNDNILSNMRLYSHAMPPIVTLVLLVIALAINPLLGPRRLRSGEMMVIVVMLLSLGGVVSAGLMRSFPPSVVTPAAYLATEINTALQEPLTAERSDSIVADARSEVEAAIARVDANGDGQINIGEWRGEPLRFAEIDADHDGSVTLAELLVRHADVRAVAATPWRWTLPRELFFSIPAAGPINQDDPEYKFLVDGYRSGLQLAYETKSRIGYRSRVLWRDAAGATHQQTARSGSDLDRTSGPETLDLDYGIGARMRGKTGGTIIDTPDGAVEIIRVDQPRLPWSEWFIVLARWSPLFIGSLLAMISLGFIVRRQWIDHERLPYPIAAVTSRLMADPQGTSRFAEIFRARIFWTGFTIAAVIVTWRGLFAFGYLPIDFTTGWDFTYLTAGPPWDQIHSPSFLRPRLYLSFIALSFFLPLDVSFSMWFFFVASNLLCMQLRMSGIAVEYQSLRDATMGGYVVMVPLIVWLGRRHYLALLKAAFFGHRDPEIRHTIPFVWAFIGGCGLVTWFLWHLGAPIGASMVAVFVLMAIVLVLSRMVAEAGAPYLLFSDEHNKVLFMLTGFSLPLAAYIPLSLIGMAVMNDLGRENAGPYTVNSTYIGTQAGVPMRRLGALIFITTCGAVLIAGATLIYFSYTHDGQSEQSSAGTVANILERTGWGVRDIATDTYATTHRMNLWGYAFGAVFTAILGLGRILFSWWPLHPLIYVTSHTYATFAGYFSFFVGWLAKFLVMRYGGSSLYISLKPLAIGLIAGEAVCGTAFALARLIARANGYDLPWFAPLPM
jgi:hypothetical protein